MHGGKHNCHTCDVSLSFKVTTQQHKEATGQNYYKATGGNYHIHGKHVILAESIVKEKQEDIIEEKKMGKEEMENDNVVMCQLEKEETNGKQQCGNMPFPAAETEGKTQKKLIPHHLYTTPTKHVTIRPDDIQITSPYT